MYVKIYQSITEIPESAWDAIVGPNRLICTHRFLEAVEKSEINDCRFYYPVVYDDAGKIIAHTCVYTISTELDTFAQGVVKKFIIAIRKIWKNFLIMRSLECGTPVALGNTISVGEEKNFDALFDAIIQGIDNLSVELKINMILIRDFYHDELDRFDRCQSRGYLRIHNLPTADFKIEWEKFEDYLAALRTAYRTEIKGNMKKKNKEGVTIVTEKNFSVYAQDMEQLWNNTYTRAKEYKRERLTEKFFRNFGEYLGEKTAAIFFKKNEQLIGFFLLFFNNETLILSYCGLDYKYNKDYFIYYNLFYHLIRLGIDRRMKNISLGITTLYSKKAIGGQVKKLYMYMKYRKVLWRYIVPRFFDMMTPQDNVERRNVFRRTGVYAN
ncbi:MAG: GNAT family N-acetyltransferase [Candidatus Omnitrophica bacterium]|nr:GNAT family N-acetyltransferase [Candidatus Omnitrophota bacterium]